jgi:hypothetical protein
MTAAVGDSNLNKTKAKVYSLAEMC